MIELNNLSRGEWKFRQLGRMVAYLFMDRKPVYFLSTMHYPMQKVDIIRRLRTGEQQTYNVPIVVQAYNAGRSGVDTIDQLQGYYATGRRSRKWWPRLAWWLIDMAIINAYKLFKLKNRSELSSIQFRQQLMHELASEIRQPLSDITNKRRRSTNNNNQQHWPKQMESPHDCIYCSDRQNRRIRTRIQCKLCNVYLCLEPCFELYHTR